MAGSFGVVVVGGIPKMMDLDAAVGTDDAKRQPARRIPAQDPLPLLLGQPVSALPGAVAARSRPARSSGHGFQCGAWCAGLCRLSGVRCGHAQTHQLRVGEFADNG